MKELILGGHSFGGLTAVATASSLPEIDRPKAVLTLDPSLYAFCDEIIAGDYKVPCPMQVINSEYFYFYSNQGYPAWDTLMALLKNSE